MMSSEIRSYSQNALPDAIDLSHHLSTLSKNRLPSPLKGLQKYFGKPGILSIAGGLPHPSYFPFDKLAADALIPETFAVHAHAPQSSKGGLTWFWNLISGSREAIMPISVPKYPENPDDINLAVALQYGLSKGLPQLQKITYEFSKTVYKPGYANFTTILHDGNTDGWSKAIMTLCNPGEGILTSEWTYPSAIATMKPHNISPVPVGMDAEGMSSTSLRQILSSWDVQTRGMPRPHVIYIVPVGQNPTGATMQIQRKKEIYDICVEFDIIIVEDDPYYFLQEGKYVLPARRTTSKSSAVPSDAEYINSLVPSFLSVDYQGRVVRLDTVSKTIAPGSRLGWFTCNPIFAERLERQSETSTQQPCGFGQAIITELLINWKATGYLRWLKGLRAQYTQRRDFLVDCFVNKFHVEVVPGVQEGTDTRSERYLFSWKVPMSWYNNKEKNRHRLTLFSFVPPSSGMFIWMQFDFASHPKIKEFGQEGLETKFWIALAEAGLLIGPGEMFSATGLDKTFNGPGHYRLSFSNAEYDDLKRAVDIFAAVVKDFYEL